MKTLNSQWKSPRLIIEDLMYEEIEVVQELYETSLHSIAWEGRDPDPDFINHCYSNGDLPPEGKKENYRIQTVKANSGQELIGVLGTYHGYPSDNVIYISSICIGDQFKKQGYGQEIINQLIIESREFEQIRINVALKNWSALRFWIRMGFENISGIYGDKEYSENSYGQIELSRFL